jgi:transcriptional regulator with XRE-family HTH domain
LTTFAHGRYSAAKEQLASACDRQSAKCTRSFGSEVKRLFDTSQSSIRLGPAQLKMAESIGEKLRLARETRGIALRDISEQTRISMRYLEAIESDDYRRLPGGIFNRSFVRAYAKFIGYDEQEAIDDYVRMLREHGDSGDEVNTKPFGSLVYLEGGRHSRSPLMTLLLAIVILAVLTACVLAGLHFYRRSAASKVRSGTDQRFAPNNRPGTPPGNPLDANQVHQTSRLTRVPYAWKTKEGQHEFTV